VKAPHVAVAEAGG